MHRNIGRNNLEDAVAARRAALGQARRSGWGCPNLRLQTLQ